LGKKVIVLGLPVPGWLLFIDLCREWFLAALFFLMFARGSRCNWVVYE